MFERKVKLEKWLDGIKTNIFTTDEHVLKIGDHRYAASPKMISELREELKNINELLETDLGRVIYGEV